MSDQFHALMQSRLRCRLVGQPGVYHPGTAETSLDSAIKSAGLRQYRLEPISEDPFPANVDWEPSFWLVYDNGGNGFGVVHGHPTNTQHTRGEAALLYRCHSQTETTVPVGTPTP